MKAHTSETQRTITPEKALQFLKEGNARFVNNLKVNRNLLQQANETREGQWPFAVILSCIDSRTSAELIFDQGLGDVFSIRVAGNVVNLDASTTLASLTLNSGGGIISTGGQNRSAIAPGGTLFNAAGALTRLGGAVMAPEIVAASSFSLSVGTPQHSAASSLSRMARRPRPIQDVST
mgnify:CR=1 FL=1